MVGIYKITNLINGNSYIGQSVNIFKRWQQEKEDSNNVNSHSYNYPLMRAFRKYGVDNFSFEILEECNVEDLNEREMYWISFYDTFFNGYNQTLGGDSKSNQPKEKIIGIIYDLMNSDMTHRDIAEKWDISVEMVQGINTGRYWRHDADYPLQKRQTSKIYYCEKCGKEISRGSKLCIDCYNILRESSCIKKPDKQTLFKDLCESQGNFTLVGSKYGVRDNTIRKLCVKYGIPSHSSDYKTNTVRENVREFKIGVIQIDKDTNEQINCFESIIDATRSLGLNNNCVSHISKVCQGKRRAAYGYKWKYLDDYQI